MRTRESFLETYCPYLAGKETQDVGLCVLAFMYLRSIHPFWVWSYMMTVGVKTIWRKQSGVGGNGQQQWYQEGLEDDSAGKCYGKK